MAAYFDGKDTDLLESALELIPDLLPTVLVAKSVREKLTYPIKSIEVFEPYFTKNKISLPNKTTITYQQVQRFLPPEFFPIETERDLLCRLLIAFQRGRLSHYLHQTKAAAKQHLAGKGEVTLLPSPSLTISGLLRLNRKQ